MANQNEQATKAQVQSDEFNKLPVPGQDDTEFSAEEAAEVFQSNPNSNSNNQSQDQ
ncbi:hypothetical protein ACFPES_13450 [Paenibacillus sp. GCM10023248]|uniref:hypothetical protein n=1 Tax=Bacillales TaxID=1385 RepID=UPI002379BEB9|nr:MULTISPECIES: hypothetical protein [Bacillales]MDD9268038.1 hypothetical protein [Paenibacillus sp. MAHUQ-63]MDR6879711.1 hypothetical protein [Bacillus sp. 3255]